MCTSANLTSSPADIQGAATDQGPACRPRARVTVAPCITSAISLGFTGRWGAEFGGLRTVNRGVSDWR
jgi:hypothetical protein